jgi:hypothetical protein
LHTVQCTCFPAADSGTWSFLLHPQHVTAKGIGISRKKLKNIRLSYDVSIRGASFFIFSDETTLNSAGCYER